MKEGNMKSSILTYIAAISLFVVVAIPAQLAAQDQQEHHNTQVHYIVTNLGNPLGGTASAAQGINNGGWVDGDSSLTGDATEHAVLWRNGKITDLGTLGGLNSSGGPVTEMGLITGWAQTSTVDPLGENWGLEFGCTPSGGSCQGYQNLVLGFLWQNGVMTPLPTLGGNNSLASFTQGANNRGQVVGLAENATQDPNCMAPQVLDFEAVIWGPRVGEIHELPPFPGDSVGAALGINDNGQAVGGSGICAFPSFADLVHALLWQRGSVTNLGSLGGVMNNFALAINNRGQVVGESDLPGDATGHAFLWTKENGMQDLGTLPGDFSSAAYGINNQGQVVVESCDVNGNCRVALWQDGVMTDLNTLTSPGSLYLVSPFAINDRGEIVGYACVISNGACNSETQLAFLATPCDGKGDCEAGLSPSQKVILPDNLRKQLQQRRGFGRFGSTNVPGADILKEPLGIDFGSTANACYPLGHYCKSGSQCCSNLCWDLRCCDKPYRDQYCTSSTECCSGACVNHRCQ
jgi:probable HAF family extracellular repeat protein